MTISIITPARTGLEFLNEAILSVQAQTYTEWEWLIGINGFQRGSEQYRAASKLECDKVRVFDLWECSNKPQTSAILVSAAQGEFIAVLDADDLWLPSKLEKQAALVDKFPVVGTKATYFGTHSGPIDVPSGLVTFDMLLSANGIINSSVLMRRELAEWEDTDGLDDYRMWLSLSRRGVALYNLDEELTMIRCHPGQWFATRSDAEQCRAEYSH